MCWLHQHRIDYLDVYAPNTTAIRDSWRHGAWREAGRTITRGCPKLSHHGTSQEGAKTSPMVLKLGLTAFVARMERGLE